MDQGNLQAFTNCMHSYDCACKVHENGATHAQELIKNIIENYLLLAHTV